MEGNFQSRINQNEGSIAKLVTVKIREIIWDWKARPTESNQICELHMLASMIGTFQPTTRLEYWYCSLDTDGTYHVDALKEKIDKPSTTRREAIIQWVYEVLIKVTCFIWRANLHHIPTKCGLQKRGITLFLQYVVILISLLKIPIML